MIKHRSEIHQLLVSLPGDMAEIGVAEGRFSLEMLKWPLHKKLFLVDRWSSVVGQRGDGSLPQQWHDENLKQVEERTAPFRERVVLLRGNSTVMARKVLDASLCLVYIDADHSYEAVSADIKAWRQKLVPKGIMAFHDYQNKNYGVHEAVNDYAQANGFVVMPIEENHPQDAGAYFVC